MFLHLLRSENRAEFSSGPAVSAHPIHNAKAWDEKEQSLPLLACVCQIQWSGQHYISVLYIWSFPAWLRNPVLQKYHSKDHQCYTMHQDAENHSVLIQGSWQTEDRSDSF